MTKTAENKIISFPLRRIQLRQQRANVAEILPDNASGRGAELLLDDEFVQLPNGWMLPYEELGELALPSNGEPRLVIAGALRGQHKWVFCSVHAGAFAAQDGMQQTYAEIARRASAYSQEDAAAVQDALAQPNAGLRLRVGSLPWLSVVLGLLMAALWYTQPSFGFGDRVLGAVLQGALVPDLVRAGEWLRLFTTGLIHLQAWKLILILFGFVVLGSVAERFWGPWRLTLVLVLVMLAFAFPAMTPTAGLVTGATVLISGLGAALWLYLARLGTVPRVGAFLVIGVALALLSLETLVLGPLHLPAFLIGLACGLMPLSDPGRSGRGDQYIAWAGKAAAALLVLALLRAGYDCLAQPDERLAGILSELSLMGSPDCDHLNDYVERIGYQPGTTPLLHRTALEVAQTCVGHDVGNPMFRAGLAGAYHSLGQWDEAVEQMRIALRLAEQSTSMDPRWFQARLDNYSKRAQTDAKQP